MDAHVRTKSRLYATAAGTPQTPKFIAARARFDHDDVLFFIAFTDIRTMDIRKLCRQPLAGTEIFLHTEKTSNGEYNFFWSPKFSN